ncbi:hypothetical protein EVG20_g11545 [Dentipellis fragilis]|uniref:Uncharacterized protein n=1 Tax=Dentipellis fragilis TaxID=205917 RepID=A0A4Y9XM10_9AGAM|nr:hypothetical protein EVG20_g11545 [Dentipellis fragilis]
MHVYPVNYAEDDTTCVALAIGNAAGPFQRERKDANRAVEVRFSASTLSFVARLIRTSRRRRSSQPDSRRAFYGQLEPGSVSDERHHTSRDTCYIEYHGLRRPSQAQHAMTRSSLNHVGFATVMSSREYPNKSNSTQVGRATSKQPSTGTTDCMKCGGYITLPQLRDHRRRY